MIARVGPSPETEAAVRWCCAASESEASPLPKAKAFQESQRDVEDRTEEEPVVTRLEQVGSYRMVGD